MFLLVGINHYCTYSNSIQLLSLTKFHVLHEIIHFRVITLVHTDLSYFFLKMCNLIPLYFKKVIPYTLILYCMLFDTKYCVHLCVHECSQIMMVLLLQISVWDCLALLELSVSSPFPLIRLNF